MMALRLKNKYIIMSATALLAFILCVFLLMITPFYEDKVTGNMICPPSVSYKVIDQRGTEDDMVKNIIVYLPKSEYSHSSVRQIFHCIANENPKSNVLAIKLFTKIEYAKWEYFFLNKIFSLRASLNLFYYDACFIRDYNVHSHNYSLNESYKYRPYLWFPFYYRTVKLRSDIPANP
ncbi:MAG: hypothetical protein IPM66_23325 [Acidobacteriota bacterium]|nr:MAG: hypothetical protein IPM66_23325 [Acidobacteriota bacterium]